MGEIEKDMKEYIDNKGGHARQREEERGRRKTNQSGINKGDLGL